eukprot:scaffold90855_cov69-Phaeocystis_antarctica.AAC.1
MSVAALAHSTHLITTDRGREPTKREPAPNPNGRASTAPARANHRAAAISGRSSGTTGRIA